MRALALFALMLVSMVAIATPTLRVDGTTLVVRDDQGIERSGKQLDGTELDLGALGTLRIRAQSHDPDDRFPDETWLIAADMRAVGAPAFAPACAGRPGTDTRLIVYSGYLDPQLRYVADRERFSITCLSGVEAKCLRWGYLPWKIAPIGGVPLAPYFETCVRLARADYCGDGHPTTREGTAIDAYDEVGIMQRTPNLPDFAFEAGWTPNGATCVHHARIPENLDVHDLPRDCPRLADAVIGEACDETMAIRQGALIVTRSVIRGR